MKLLVGVTLFGRPLKMLHSHKQIATVMDANLIRARMVIIFEKRLWPIS